MKKFIVLFVLLIGLGTSALVYSRRAPGPGPKSVPTPPSGQTSATRRATTVPVGLPAFQGGGALQGVAEFVPGPPYQKRWTFKAGGEDKASISSSPTIAGDVVYAADTEGILHALALADGKERWQYKTESSFETTPLIVGDRLFIGDLDGFMHCVSVLKGTNIWKFDSGGPIHASANLTPDGKLVLFGNDSATVFALETATGKKSWEGRGGDRINACPAIGDGVAFFTGCDARLLALKLSDGTEKWAAELGGMAPGSPTVLDDRIIAATGEGTVLAYSPDGKKQLWKYEDVNAQGSMFYSSPAVAEGIIVIGCRDRQVHAIDAKTGKRVWAFVTRGEVDAPAVISDGRVYVGSKDKKFYVLELKTGKPLWEFTAGRSITAGAAIGGGVIVVGDSAGHIYCLEPKLP